MAFVQCALTHIGNANINLCSFGLFVSCFSSGCHLKRQFGSQAFNGSQCSLDDYSCLALPTRSKLRLCDDHVIKVHQTKVCTGVTERVGELGRSEEEEAERFAASRFNSSTLFWSSARFASSSL